jgi:hypothetical protein
MTRENSGFFASVIQFASEMRRCASEAFTGNPKSARTPHTAATPPADTSSAGCAVFPRTNKQVYSGGRGATA